MYFMPAWGLLMKERRYHPQHSAAENVPCASVAERNSVLILDVPRPLSLCMCTHVVWHPREGYYGGHHKWAPRAAFEATPTRLQDGP